MKRFHVHVAVPSLEESIGFYSTLFGSQPAVRKPDYAKWMLDDPRVNFAISQRGQGAGVDHLGLEVDSDAELAAAHAQLVAAGGRVMAESNARCCYAVSDKHWVTDPAGIAWETFHSLGDIPVYGEAAAEERRGTDESVCCGIGVAPSEASKAAKHRCGCAST